MQVFIQTRWFHTPSARKQGILLSVNKKSVYSLTLEFCCNCFQAALDARDFYGHWFPWYGRVISKALDLPVSARVLRLPCLQSSSRKMPGWVFSLSAWDVHGATINVSMSRVPEAAPVKTLTGWRDVRREEESTSSIASQSESSKCT